jgi:tRNA(Ile)-lysidine synthase
VEKDVPFFQFFSPRRGRHKSNKMNQTISIIDSFLKSVPINPGDKILAAVSGGADSIAMLHLLKTQSTIYNLSPRDLQYTILCAHINHHLRDKESDEDQAFMETLCADWNIPFYTEHIDVKAYAAQEKLSIETAARHLRLEALEHIARKTGCAYIATAHHKDDQAETVLFRLLRGTAFSGLTGIRPTREHHSLQWIRPMLNIRKSQIEAYCKENNIAWRNDATNIETHYRRNWIRHKLLPYMQQQSRTDLTETLAALAQSALKLQEQVETSANKILPRRVCSSAAHAKSLSLPRSLDCEANTAVPSNNKIGDSYLLLQNLSIIKQSGPFVTGEILRTILAHLNCGLRDISLLHYKKFFQLLEKSRGTLQLPAGCTISKKNDSLTFETNVSCRVCSSAAHAKSAQLPIPGTIQFAGWSIQTRMIQITQNDLDTFQKQNDNRTQWFNPKQLQSPLIVRSRRKDDAFTPFGRKTKKRIARFLTDSQIDETQRESCFVIEDSSAILWLAPVRRSALAPVTPNTTEALEIRITPV